MRESGILLVGRDPQDGALPAVDRFQFRPPAGIQVLVFLENLSIGADDRSLSRGESGAEPP